MSAAREPITVEVAHQGKRFRFVYDHPDATPRVRRYVAPRKGAAQHWREVSFASVPFGACVEARDLAYKSATVPS